MSIDGLDVSVTRKRVRNINLRVQRDGSVIVSAPKRVPLGEIERFVRSKQAWIGRARQRQERQAHQMNCSCAPGSRVYLWGRELACTVVARDEGDRRRSWSFEASGNLLLVHPAVPTSGGEPSYEQGGKRLSAWLIGQLSDRVEEVLPHWQLVVGKSCSDVRLRSMTSRWGSCNVKTGAITLNTHLVHYDPRCLEYVICHELCHLHEASHNARFHALMDQFYPGWRDVRSLLASE